LKRSLRRPRRRLGDIIKINIKRRECEEDIDWIYVVQDGAMAGYWEHID